MNLINDDCMNILPDYPDDYFDLAIVDPPYGLKIQQSGGTPEHLGFKNYTKKHWDNNIPSKEYFEQLFRVSKNQIIWGANYYTKYLPSSMGWVFWDKGQDLTMSDGELAFTSFQKALRRKIINRSEIKKDVPIHPTQKPIRLYRWLLENYAEPTNKILDTHLGSGSIAIACHYFGTEEFVGIEIDKEYFDNAKTRIEKETRQIKLL